MVSVLLFAPIDDAFKFNLAIYVKIDFHKIDGVTSKLAILSEIIYCCCYTCSRFYREPFSLQYFINGADK